MSIQKRILELIHREGPLTREQILQKMKVNNDLRKEFKTLIKNMVKEGQLYKDEEKKFHIVSKENLLVGTLQGNEKGFGFLLPEEEGVEDVYIHETKMNSALHGDRILVRLREKREGDKRLEGIVEEVLERSTKTIVGTYDDAGKFGFVIPDETRMGTDIFIPKKRKMGAKEGQKVVVAIDKYPTPSRKPEGRIIEVLGYPEDKGVDVMSVAYSMDIPIEFPKEVLEEAKAIPDTVPANSLRARLDLREVKTFTIDGADSKDFDDAISIEEKENGKYELGIHIADVAEYVRENTHLDREARERGNSVYLLNKVIPMLPEELSNGICSLNEDVDRLTLSLLVEIDIEGNVTGHKLAESVIRSHRRMVYGNVSDFLEDNSKVHYSLEGFEEELLTMEKIARARLKKRNERGNIDFAFAEPNIQLDEEGRPISITVEDRRFANQLIEEFMLLANETVAKEYSDKKLPFLYRIHEEPDEEKLEVLNSIIRPFGYHLSVSEEIQPKDVQALMKKIKGKKEELLISTMVLRSMQKARYSYERDIHFGLAAEYYSHFTSPIRRYSDLTIHRVIKADLNKQLTSKLIARYQSIFPDIASHVSATEKTAQEAERKVADVKMAQYMMDHIGEEFTARVSGITGFGIFAELENTIEGLISYHSMGEFYHFDEENYRAVAEHSKKEFHIGDEIKIKVVAADPIKGRIDFSLGGEEDGEESREGNAGKES
ncbi:ribonuclease R [Peptoniphilus sp. KCTC 25270]|uniref:ribonuclease R n=1 Tax=Peptoniphilus sp. KCTC 25270 TaxID=2897414 RepID=UPI001E37C291|nr:ribonuclease R [Peptoniphilus sp. KCTC 25270]MCD1147370.1 ribonuclease R [Peptoniphilus sp. KCTC 25270]